jgi:hypothetical protein
MKVYSARRNGNTRRDTRAERPPGLFFRLRSSTIETQYALIEQARAARASSMASKNEDPRREGMNFTSEIAAEASEPDSRADESKSPQ